MLGMTKEYNRLSCKQKFTSRLGWFDLAFNNIEHFFNFLSQKCKKVLAL